MVEKAFRKPPAPSRKTGDVMSTAMNANHVGNNDVLVVGAGIAGMQTALLLAEQDHHVYLMDNAPAIGGFFPLLDRTFPTNYCGRCFMSPKSPSYCPIYENDFHDNITLLTSCDIESVSGSVGDFSIEYTKRPRYVDADKCNLCMKCSDICPVEVDREFGGGVEKRKAIYLPFMQAIPRCFVIDPTICTECNACVEECPADAITLNVAPERKSLSAGSIVLGFGFEPVPPGVKGEYGFGRYENVFSSIQFERLLGTSGPTAGVPVRHSDGQTVRRLAFIQCVGSRDPSANLSYCSSVCCRIAAKQAIVAKERVEGLDAAIFYMDIRAMGKEYEAYYESAREEYGVRYIRSAISTVREFQQTKNIEITYATDSGELHTEEFDAVVLSHGFSAPSSIVETASRLGIGLNESGFCEGGEFAPNQTTVPGVFAAGAFREPKDIPESIVDACSAAADVASLYPVPRNAAAEAIDDAVDMMQSQAIRNDPVRFGIFICDRHDLLRDGLSIIDLVGDLSLDKDIVIVRWIDFTDVANGLDEVKNLIAERSVNRVIIAGYRCLEIHKYIKKHTGVLGTYSNLFSISNIGEQCANVHVGDRESATMKALGLIRASQEAVRYVVPKQRGQKTVNQDVLVVGGGISGLSAAASLASQGMRVSLVEKDGHLGGNARDIRYTIKGGDLSNFLETLITQVEDDPLIDIYTNATVESVEGTWGDFSSNIVLNLENGGPSTDTQPDEGQSDDGAVGEAKSIDHGALIFAVGGKQIEPEGYLYGENPNVLTQRELEHRIADNPSSIADVTTVSMIQCVNCRNEKHPYCSRICCIHAMKNALKLLDAQPTMRIFVFYRDIRTYGFYEQYYRDARERGVVFIRYEPGNEPVVRNNNGRTNIVFTDPLIGHEMELANDLVVLSTGIEPSTTDIADVVGVKVNTDGFFAEANPKSAPLDSVSRGVFYAGICHSPNLIENVICQGKATAARAAALLWSEVSEFADYRVEVNERMCSGCGICISECPYSARKIDEFTGRAVVLEDLCKGCGTCAVACPNGATRQDNFEPSTVIRMIEEVLQ
jgi:heterodisulfide reductase subunit A2